ncbi:MAG: ABC transporter permease [Oscillospiraceae bacterium]|nr:ABC transporter permease [Oscillospiraceae bacterium]
MLFFLYSPIAVLIVYSFNESKSRANWSGFTLKWYAQLFGDPGIMNALATTLSVAALSSAAATTIGTAAAIGIDSMKGAKKRLVMGLTNIPVVIPEIVIGVSLMILFMYVCGALGVGMGYHTLLLAHVIFNVPFVILSVLPKLRQTDENLIEAALDLGASPSSAFFKVLLPQIMPGVITGAMLAFTLSIDDFIVSFFTAGAGTTNLSILIFSMARLGINPKINALSAIMFTVVLLLLYLINKRETINKKRREKNAQIR